MAGSPPSPQTPRAAVALGYNPEKDSAPRVLAAGRGELAEAILAQADRHRVPVVEQHPLADALVKLQVGASVPPELYAAVAEVLAYLWRVEQQQADAQAQARAGKGGGGA